MKYSAGSLVKVRGREWVVLSEPKNNILTVRPIGGLAEETTGIHLGLETIEPAEFDLPDPSEIGDYRSSRLLRNAVRLNARSSVGPFRSLSQIAVDPRPYQLVPLLMALKLNPIRLGIADDVGIGKTIEACLIARELLDRGEIERIAVLCPPHLAEQWQKELKQKFHIDAELVLRGTVNRLERNLQIGESLFDVYRHVIVSMDYIKSDRRRDEFVRACPEFVIVDEAHTCAFGYEGKGSRHQRNQLVKQLAASPVRHIVLITATPHSGNEETFRSLLTFLDKDFADLPQDLTGPANAEHRRKLAQQFVQRRRADIRHFMKTETPFPERVEAEESYKLSSEYKKLFDRALAYARETVLDSKGGRHKQRVRWWSALALLRSLASSPAAAEATLRERAKVSETTTVEEVDEIGRQSVFDIEIEDSAEGTDVTPGSDLGDETDEDKRNRKSLLEMARIAASLKGKEDLKLQKAVIFIKTMIEEGYNPIIFCRFISTAEYLADELRTHLNRHYKDLEIDAVTGLLPPDEREDRVEALGVANRRILVATDCLSEGINLQDRFDAVIHYDLSWSPTRHEQREGRVDRYGQRKDPVRVLTYYGVDNQIDGIVLDILIRKHKKIRSDTGVSIPLPGDTNKIVDAIFEGLLLRENAGGQAEHYLPGLEDFLKPKKEDLYIQWENAADREKRSRSVFAQETIKFEEVAEAIADVSRAIGTVTDIESFTLDALRAYGATINQSKNVYELNLKEVPRAVRDGLSEEDKLKVYFDLPAAQGAYHLIRTHPIVANLASNVMETALDPQLKGIARRAGAILTKAVQTRTTLLVVRFRYDFISGIVKTQQNQLIEECITFAFEGAPEKAQWLGSDESENLMLASPSGNIAPDRARDFVLKVIEGVKPLRAYLDEQANVRARKLLAAHQKVRSAAKFKGAIYKVEPRLPPDILGIYIYLPATS